MTLVQQQLVGRSAEQAAIAKLVEHSQDGTRCLLLEGEAGMGKTRLWQTAGSVAGGSGYRRLSSAPTEAESGLPFAVLGDLLHTVPEEAIATLSGPLRMAQEVALFRTSSKQGATDQLAVCTAFLRVLRHLAADDPLRWLPASRHVVESGLNFLGFLQYLRQRRLRQPGMELPVGRRFPGHDV